MCRRALCGYGCVTIKDALSGYYGFSYFVGHWLAFAGCLVSERDLAFPSLRVLGFSGCRKEFWISGFPKGV